MPPVSQKQAKFMRAVAAGDVKKKGLSRKEAHEYVKGHSTKDLPERSPREMQRARYMRRK